MPAPSHPTQSKRRGNEAVGNQAVGNHGNFTEFKQHKFVSCWLLFGA